jgi:hypothetical protein
MVSTELGPWNSELQRCSWQTACEAGQQVLLHEDTQQIFPFFLEFFRHQSKMGV